MSNKVLDITYKCLNCGFSPDEPKSMICPKCGGDLRGQGMPSVTGTRDGFGIGRKFYHTNEDGSRKEITTWREWEKAGYKDAISDTRNSTVREMAKEKMKKIKRNGGRSML